MLFNNFPARCDLYINLNRLDNFPFMFCQMKWVEDESVSSRAIDVWKFVILMNHYDSLSKSKCPKNK